MVRRWVWRGEPLYNFLFYLIPYSHVSAFAIQVMEVEGHEHLISSILFEISFVFFSLCFASSLIFPEIATLAFAESGCTTARQRKVGNWMGVLCTLFVLNGRLQGLSYGHPYLLPYQII